MKRPVISERMFLYWTDRRTWIFPWLPPQTMDGCIN